MQAGLALLTDHVARFNAGVRSGDFGPMVDGFTRPAARQDYLGCRDRSAFGP